VPGAGHPHLTAPGLLWPCHEGAQTAAALRLRKFAESDFLGPDRCSFAAAVAKLQLKVLEASLEERRHRARTPVGTEQVSRLTLRPVVAPYRGICSGARMDVSTSPPSSLSVGEVVAAALSSDILTPRDIPGRFNLTGTGRLSLPHGSSLLVCDRGHSPRTHRSPRTVWRTWPHSDDSSNLRAAVVVSSGNCCNGAVGRADDLARRFPNVDLQSAARPVCLT
jgi:hypothetical protein